MNHLRGSMHHIRSELTRNVPHGQRTGAPNKVPLARISDLRPRLVLQRRHVSSSCPSSLKRPYCVLYLRGRREPLRSIYHTHREHSRWCDACRRHTPGLPQQFSTNLATRELIPPPARPLSHQLHCLASNQQLQQSTLTVWIFQWLFTASHTMP